MKTADQVVAWLVLILGAVHSAFTAKLFPTLNQSAMWFLSAGLLMMLLAAVNLLRVAYAGVAGGVRTVCIVANVIVLVFIIKVATTLSISRNPQAVTLVALMALMTIFSIVRRPARA